MLFNSWGYLLFLTIAITAHWIVPKKWRVILLGLFSILFYSLWRWEFSFLVIFSACVDFVSAGRIHSSEKPGVRKTWLLISLIINLGLLLFFKYTYFFVDNINFIASQAGFSGFSGSTIALRIILPLGISFYTFQTISYTIDVYRRVITPTRSYASFFTYVTFWPQLIAGPVLRAGEVLPQLESDREVDAEDIHQGIVRILTGLFKKVVIADNLAPIVDHFFRMDPSSSVAPDVWVATFLFGFQIYFDFAGYSDIAIGSARLAGIKLMENFHWPYLVATPREFWQRWHISLSSWIRDYLYLPLTGQKFRTESRDGLAVATQQNGVRKNAALFLTWFIMGLWHGAGWNFALWGIYQAVLVILFRVIKPLDRIASRYPAFIWFPLLPLIMAGWIFFRAESVEQAMQLFSVILSTIKVHVCWSFVAWIGLFGGAATYSKYATRLFFAETLVCNQSDPYGHP